MMQGKRLTSMLWRGKFWRLTMMLGSVATVVGVAGCGGDERDDKPGSSSVEVDRISQGSVDKVDLLFVIDNSRGMSDKQEILVEAIPDFVNGLVNPPCVNPSDPTQNVMAQSPTDPCPAGLERLFTPVLDMHIGVISTSLGGHGSDACKADSVSTQTNNDRGRLLARVDPTSSQAIETYQGKGFLAWDPEQKLVIYDQGGSATPAPGEADLTVDSAQDTNNTALVPQLRDMVIGVGQIGCGYESQLESWYRFLVDPEPYDTISVQNGVATPQGIDTTLLSQRADFLRPSSLLAIVLISDENDCSIRESGQFYLAAQLMNSNGSVFHLPPARAICATNPNDPCCMSCGQPDGTCGPDPSCKNPDGSTRVLSDLEDSVNLRCYDQKRRFGIDFLYPIDRYTKALMDPTVANRAGEIVPNPIFNDLNPLDSDTSVRAPNQVVFAGIVGVPWQDIARQNAVEAPDLLTGNNEKGLPVGGFKNASELSLPNGQFASTWDIILGDPANYIYPGDPLMIESIDPRSGINPITGDAASQPGSPPWSNPINGKEWTIQGRNDLQYSCIFPLAFPRDCSIPGQAACDCSDQPDNLTNPLCELDPGGSGQRTYQVAAKAYPGIRPLQFIKSLGNQGVVGSICPEQINDPGLLNFAYRPTATGLVEAARGGLGGQCLGRTLTPDQDGQVGCAVLEVRNSMGQCTCDDVARQDVSKSYQAGADAILADPVAVPAGWDCVCEITQTQGDELQACQFDITPPVQTQSGVDVDGWCYIDATQSPPVGDPALVASCPSTEARILRFVGKGEALPGSTLYLACKPE